MTAASQKFGSVEPKGSIIKRDDHLQRKEGEGGVRGRGRDREIKGLVFHLGYTTSFSTHLNVNLLTENSLTLNLHWLKKKLVGGSH